MKLFYLNLHGTLTDITFGNAHPSHNVSIVFSTCKKVIDRKLGEEGKKK